jgi:hypothetical protein
MDLSPQIREALETAITKNALTDTVNYLTGLTVMPDEKGVPKVVTIITLTMNSTVLGEHYTAAFFVDTPVPTFDQLDDPVAAALEGMRQQRHAEAQQLMQEGNGSSPGRRFELPGM